MRPGHLVGGCTLRRQKGPRNSTDTWRALVSVAACHLSAVQSVEISQQANVRANRLDPKPQTLNMRANRLNPTLMNRKSHTATDVRGLVLQCCQASGQPLKSPRLCLRSNNKFLCACRMKDFLPPLSGQRRAIFHPVGIVCAYACAFLLAQTMCFQT